MRRALGWISFTIAVLAVAAAGFWWSARTPVPDAPRIESIGSMDADVATLLRKLRAAIGEKPASADAWGRFGMGCEANGFVGAARDAYRVAAGLAPEEPRWTYRLSLVAFRLGEHETALAALSRVNDLAPRYAPAWARRGVWLLDRGDTNGAEAAFNRTLAIDSGTLAASTGLARAHLQRRDNARAVEVLEALLERHPGDRYALQLLGTAYRRLGRVDEASFALAVGAGGEPEWRDPWSEEIGTYRRGFATVLKAATAEAMAGRFDRALPLLDRLRSRSPDDISLANHTAEVLTSAGRHAEAIRLLTATIDARADNADTHLALASAYLASGDIARAEAHADRAIEMNASGGRALELKGVIAWRDARGGQASALFERALARDPRNVKLLAWIGLIELEARRPRDAAAAFAEVLRRDPLQPDALAGLALAQHELGAEADAAVALARAEQVAPAHPRVREARTRLQRGTRR